MKQIIYNDYAELSVKTAKQIADIITEKPDALCEQHFSYFSN